MHDYDTSPDTEDLDFLERYAQEHDFIGIAKSKHTGRIVLMDRMLRPVTLAHTGLRDAIAALQLRGIPETEVPNVP